MPGHRYRSEARHRADLRTPPGRYRSVIDMTTTARTTNQAQAVSDEDRRIFERLLDLEAQTQITKNVAGFIVGDGHAVQKREQARLFREVAALTPAQAAAFGRYRLAAR